MTGSQNRLFLLKPPIITTESIGYMYVVTSPSQSELFWWKTEYGSDILVNGQSTYKNQQYTKKKWGNKAKDLTPEICVAFFLVFNIYFVQTRFHTTENIISRIYQIFLYCWNYI